MTAATPANENETCRRCGGQNVVWYAPSPLWNAVMRGGSIDGLWEYGELICPPCFIALAEERGIVAGGWRLDARNLNVQLETTTPTGRTWDASRDLWVDPAATPGRDELREQIAAARPTGGDYDVPGLSVGGTEWRAPAPAAELNERIAAVLREHYWSADDEKVCGCGWTHPEWDAATDNEDDAAMEAVFQAFVLHQAAAAASVVDTWVAAHTEQGAEDGQVAALRVLSDAAHRGRWVIGFESTVLSTSRDDVLGTLRDRNDVAFAAAAVNYVRAVLDGPPQHE